MGDLLPEARDEAWDLVTLLVDDGVSIAPAGRR